MEGKAETKDGKKRLKTAWILIALTAADCACTASGVRMGAITEANPLFLGWMSISPEYTVSLTFAGVSAMVLIVYILGSRVPWSGTALAGLAAAKLAVLGLHFGWILRLL